MDLWEETQSREHFTTLINPALVYRRFLWCFWSSAMLLIRSWVATWDRGTCWTDRASRNRQGVEQPSCACGWGQKGKVKKEVKPCRRMLSDCTLNKIKRYLFTKRICTGTSKKQKVPRYWCSGTGDRQQTNACLTVCLPALSCDCWKMNVLPVSDSFSWDFLLTVTKLARCHCCYLSWFMTFQKGMLGVSLSITQATPVKGETNEFAAREGHAKKGAGEECVCACANVFVLKKCKREGDFKVMQSCWRPFLLNWTAQFINCTSVFTPHNLYLIYLAKWIRHFLVRIPNFLCMHYN